jgi:uncharacterized protein with FMN-binding domain/Pyruvate/2-oxoacid:ferredoxin oxidoreductase delta subunit
MKKPEISIIQVVKQLIQILFFIFLPALYVNAFAGIKQIYLALISQNFNLTQLMPQLLEAFIIIPLTIIMGRFFCGWMCALGAFGDFIYSISRKLFKVKFKMDEKVDQALKYVKYIVLTFLIFVVWSFNITVFSTFSPWDVFGMLAAVGKTPDFSYVAANLTGGLVLFILIVIASSFIERFFCRYLCPLGAVFAITSKLRIAKIRKSRTKCGNCRICTNNCAMGIPLYQTDAVNSGECIHCMKCVTACPRKNVTVTVSEKDVRPLMAGAAVVSVMTGLYYAGNLGMSSAGINNVQVTSQSNQTTSNKTYKDGTYQGSGSGFRGATTTVSVVVKNDKITKITTLSYGDDAPFYNRAYPVVSKEIISSQTVDVDAVSGATFSSIGIMQAVEDALSNAKISSISSNVSDTSSVTAESDQAQSSSTAVTDTTSAQTQTTDVQTQASSVQTSESTQASSGTSTEYKDGTYQGSGTGFRGAETTVSVVVKDGKITDITTVSYGDDRPYFSRAFPTVSEEIISNQGTDVNAVSGATYSSRGIMQAVEDALSKAM